MSDATNATGLERPVTRPGLDGMRAAMYGEMAAAVARQRPWCERQRDWDAAFEGAIQFIEAAGLDDRTSRRLLDEAAATRNAGALTEWDVTVEELCDRLAAEFRHRLRTQG